MNFEYFIAKRIIGTKSYKSSISAPIIKIGITAIAIGIIVMLIAIATGTGLQQKIRDKAVAFNGHITVSNFDSNRSEESQVPVSLDEEFYSKVLNIEGVTHFQAVAAKFGIIRTENDFEGVVMKGVGNDYDWQYFKEFLVDGTLPSYEKGTNNDVLISQYLVNRLDLAVGSSFQMFFMKNEGNQVPSIRKFNIVGVFNSGFQELDETYFIGDIKHVQRLNKWKSKEVGNFEVFIRDHSDLTVIAEEIYKNTPSHMNTTTVAEKYASIFEWISIFDNNTNGIILIMIFVAGINMITVLLVLILERTPMIGLLKALGARNFSLRRLFLYNASYLILLGMFWGNLIGLGLLYVQQQFGLFPLNPDVYYVTQVPVNITFTHVIMLNLGTFSLCLLMLLIPSIVISRISPIRAMRFD